MNHTDFLFLSIIASYFTSSNINTLEYQIVTIIWKRYEYVIEVVKINKNRNPQIRYLRFLPSTFLSTLVNVLLCSHLFLLNNCLLYCGESSVCFLSRCSWTKNETDWVQTLPVLPHQYYTDCLCSKQSSSGQPASVYPFQSWQRHHSRCRYIAQIV